MALDPVTHWIYLATADFMMGGVDDSHPRPTMVPLSSAVGLVLLSRTFSAAVVKAVVVISLEVSARMKVGALESMVPKEKFTPSVVTTA